VASEVQRRMESQVVELQSDLRQKTFELGHLRVVMGEKEGLLGQTNMQIDLMQEKMQVGVLAGSVGMEKVPPLGLKPVS
jgi:hypothetical protein